MVTQDGKGVARIDEIDFYKKQKKLVLENCGRINPKCIEDAIERDGYITAVKALTDICQSETGSLFGISTEDTQKVLKKYTSSGQFGIIGRSFFGKFLYRFLDYHLSRELPNHIGPGRNFSNINDYQGFKEALVRHCHETVLIIKDFSGCWPSATEFREGITAENVRTKCIPSAFKKIQSELKQREGADG